MNSQPALKNIREAIFRANPNYDLITPDQLPAEQQVYLSNLEALPEGSGLLYPHTADGSSIKSVGCETVQLFTALKIAGTVPPVSHEQLAHEADPNRVLAELVLDGVLEINFEGAFVSGAAAYTALYDAASPLTADGYLAKLSIQALRHAQILPERTSAALSIYLYTYNRLPLSPYWSIRLPSLDTVALFLGLNGQTATARTLEKFWVQPNSEGDKPEAGWHFWRTRSPQFTADLAQPTYKLYISPSPAALPVAFAEAIEVFADYHVQQFKVGKTAADLLRPDKLIAYMETLDQLYEVADSLCERLDGIDAHGVPFTAELGLKGLLSWGMDPPSTEHSTAWNQRESWRLWICNRLAIALTEARLQPNAALKAWQFALERLRLDGIDPSTWTPVSSLWQLT